MKLFANIKNKIDAEPIEKIRDTILEGIPLSFFPSIYALFVILINIGIALLAALYSGDVSDLPNILIRIFAIIPKAAVIVFAMTLLYYLVVNNFLKKCVYPRIREDIRENPERKTEYNLNMGITPWWAFAAVFILLIFDAAIFDQSVFASYKSALLIYFNISMTLPTVSYFTIKWIWPLHFRKAIIRDANTKR